MPKLLTKMGANAKLAKGNGPRYAPAILHLAPARLAGRENVCPHATGECIALCLNLSGRANIFPAIVDARIRKTRQYFDDRENFLNTLRRDIVNTIRGEIRKEKIPVFRLDGTSDLGLGIGFAREFPSVQFYDYTKDPIRYHQYLLGKFPQNYHLTFSFSGHNETLCVSFLQRGGTVAVTFSRPIGAKYVRPDTWNGFPTIDGDISDLRFLDAPGTVVALKAKGKARYAKGNRFVVGS